MLQIFEAEDSDPLFGYLLVRFQNSCNKTPLSIKKFFLEVAASNTKATYEIL